MRRSPPRCPSWRVGPARCAAGGVGARSPRRSWGSSSPRASRGLRAPREHASQRPRCSAPPLRRSDLTHGVRWEHEDQLCGRSRCPSVPDLGTGAGIRGFAAPAAHAPPRSSLPGSGTGVFDQRDHRGTMSFHIGAEGHSSTAEAHYSGLAIYMRQPSYSQASSLTHGKPWIKLDLRGVGNGARDQLLGAYELGRVI